MSAERVEYHEGAIADVKSAVAWYQRRSPKAAVDFIEELHRAPTQSVKPRNAGRQARTTPDDFCFGDFLFPSSIRSKNQ